MTTKEKHALHVNIDPELHKKLQNLSDFSNLPLTTYVRLLLIQHVKTPMRLSFKQRKAG